MKDKKMGRGLPRIEHPPATPKKNPFDDVSLYRCEGSDNCKEED
nr:hypothetical protein Iba_chr02dCG9300 [Ipomoea batatas]